MARSILYKYTKIHTKHHQGPHKGLYLSASQTSNPSKAKLRQESVPPGIRQTGTLNEFAQDFSCKAPRCLMTVAKKFFNSASYQPSKSTKDLLILSR